MNISKRLGGARRLKTITLVSIFLAILHLSPSNTQAETLSIDSDTAPVKTMVRPLIGENTPWLTSSDKKFTPARNTATKERLAEMGVGIARFPSGSTSQNYRWHTPTWDSVSGKYDYSDAVEGLEPRVASMAGLGTWTWAVDDDGTFPEAMDFDEFIEHCHYAGIEPLIVINAQGHKELAPGDPVIEQLSMPHALTEDEIVEEAAAWVHYANVVRGYGVKYWAIGNEIEGPHTTSVMTKDDFIRIFKKMCYKMKEVDPTIMTTPGTFQNPGWLNSFYNDSIVLSGYGTEVSKDYLDFIVTHQYLFGSNWSDSYELWESFTGDTIPKISGVNAWINAKSWPNDRKPELFITESGPTGMDTFEGVTSSSKALRFKAKSTNPYLSMWATGEAKVGYAHPIWDESIMQMYAIPGELGYVTIKASNGTSSQYLRATGLATPAAFDGDGSSSECKWRRYGPVASCFFESAAYPGYYLKVDTSTTNLVLDNSILHQASQAIALENRILSDYQKDTGAHLWESPSERLMKAYHSERFLSFASGTGFIEAKTLRGADAPPFKFQMENAGTTLDDEVKLRVIGATGPNNFLQVTGSSSAPDVDATGTGTSAASTWLFHYEDVDAANQPIGDKFRLESKLYPGKYLVYEETGSSAERITATGSASGDNGIFTFAGPPKIYATSYPDAPSTQAQKDLMSNDTHKSLVWADMLLASLKLDRVGSMVHWNTLSVWNGKFGSWNGLSDSLQPTSDLEFTSIGKVQQLITMFTIGDVLDIPSNPSTTLRSYACLDNQRGRLTVLLLNKSLSAKTLTLSFTGSDPYEPATDYETYTYHSETNDLEDIAPIVDYQSGLAYPSDNEFTIPPLCLQVLVFIDPNKAVGPIGQTFTLNSLGYDDTIPSLSMWVKSTPSDTLAIDELTEQAGAQYLELSNLFGLTQHATGTSDSYQLYPIHDSSAYAKYNNSSLADRLTLNGAAGSSDAEWSWTETWNSSYGRTYARLATKLTPAKAMRANLSSTSVPKRVDANGGAATWTQFLWDYAPPAPLGKAVMIRSHSSGNLLFSAKTGSMGAWLLPEPGEPDSNGGITHKFHVSYLSDGLITLKSDLTGGNYFLKAGNTANDQVTVLGNGAEVDLASAWRPKFDGLKVVFQSAKTGGFLTKTSGSSAVTTEAATPTSESEFYWVAVPQ